MKKKWMLLMAVLLCGLIIFTGCGNTGDPSASIDSKNAEAGTNADGSAVEERYYSFGLDETITLENLCEISDLYSEVLDDKAMKDGWYYYYTDTDKSPATVINWEVSEENYTTAEVLFTVKNISDKPQTYGDKITAKLIYQETDNAQPVSYKGTVFQQNPGQVEKNGEMIMWSTKPVEIAVGESTNVSFRFDIPKDVYKKICATAEGQNTGIKETCEFTVDNGKPVKINLAKVLIPASWSAN